MIDDSNDIGVVRKFWEKEIVVIAGDFSGHVEVMQKTMRTSMGVMAMKLGIRKGKRFWSFVQL